MADEILPDTAIFAAAHHGGPPPRRSRIVGKLIKERYADGKWHRPEVIAEAIEADLDDVLATLDNMCRHKTFGVACERKRVGTGQQFRIYKKDKTVSVDELTAVLGPIVKELAEEGRSSIARASPVRVAILAEKLRQALIRWAE
jgi:hypothetical protein